MDYLMAKQAAEKWNISPRRVYVLCKQGRIKRRCAPWLCLGDTEGRGQAKRCKA